MRHAFILNVCVGMHFSTYYRGMKHGDLQIGMLYQGLHYSELRYSESIFYAVDAVSVRTVSNHT